MIDTNCAWCGKALSTVAGGQSFCSHQCQSNYEHWCGARTILRSEAVQRWRNVSSESLAVGGEVGWGMLRGNRPLPAAVAAPERPEPSCTVRR
jgi:endogenous inhibitor of DNA gyrase (YacG/DUF329 family)